MLMFLAGGGKQKHWGVRPLGASAMFCSSALLLPAFVEQVSLVSAISGKAYAHQGDAQNWLTARR
eukprot:3172317-Amphidinium_carterae.1